ncbi:murein biosynthesis integral membrane protein MurJ [bacterium]|nr:murein biosynthesis integral membrane protein MurJ [bacterium]
MKMGGVLKAATVVTALAIISKILGIIKTVLIAYYYGRTIPAEAFFMAFSIMEFIRHAIAGGTLVSAIIPVFSALVLIGDRHKITKAASNLFTLFSLILVIVVICWYVFGPALVNQVLDLWGPRADPDTFSREMWQLTITICHVMFPAIVFFGIVSIASAILNSFQHFAAPAATAGLLNIVIIACLYLFRSSLGIYSLALGFVLGTFSQVLLLSGPLKRRLLHCSWSLSLKEDYLHDIWTLLKPLLWGLIAYRFILLMNKFFASSTGLGNVSSLTYSEMIINGFVDVIGISLATALYPTMSEYFSQKNATDFCRTADSFLRIVILVALPITGFLMVFSYPVIELFFQQKAFTQADTLATYQVLLYFAPTVLFQSFIYVIRNVFYARHDMKRPVLIAITALVVNLVLIWVLRGPFGIIGIVLASSIATGMHALTLLLLHLQYDRNFSVLSLLSFLLHLILITSLALAGSWYVYAMVTSLECIFTTLWGQVLCFIGTVILCTVLFCLAGIVTQFREMQLTWHFIRQRMIRKRELRTE